MIPEADDFLAESEALYQLIDGNTDNSLQEETAFKGWSLYEIIRHLHVWNEMALFSLNGQDQFDKAFAVLMENLKEDGGLPKKRKTSSLPSIVVPKPATRDRELKNLLTRAGPRQIEHEAQQRKLFESPFRYPQARIDSTPPEALLAKQPPPEKPLKLKPIRFQSHEDLIKKFKY